MTKEEAKQEITAINALDPEAVQTFYNVDTKEEAIRGVLEAVDEPEPEFDYTDSELRDERDFLCSSQGLSRYC